jgi:hypothetical protein
MNALIQKILLDHRQQMIRHQQLTCAIPDFAPGALFYHFGDISLFVDSAVTNMLAGLCGLSANEMLKRNMC